MEEKEAKTQSVVPTRKKKKVKDHLIDWEKAIKEIEEILKEREWTQEDHQVNHSFLSGLTTKYILGPIVKNLPSKPKKGKEV